MRFCVDCKYHRSALGQNHCLRDMAQATDLVTGVQTETGQLECKEERYGTSGCGRMAKYFEQAT
jgi:hypothetical protein